MAKEEPKSYLGLSKGRAEALTDGIFAFAMTLLVLNIEVPETISIYSTSEEVSSILGTLYPDIMHYVTAFVMLASFWMLHHRCYDHIKVVHRGMLWMNFATLLFVALIPFTTDLADEFVHAPLAGLIFSLNMFIVGFLIYAQWAYASRHDGILAETVSKEEISHIGRKMLIMPGISLFAIALALMGAPWTVLIYLTAPLAFMVVK